MANWLYTDVHGCIDELRDLYALTSPAENDTFVIAGDLLDRGPDSVAVVRFFRELSVQFNVVLVMGNHEYKHQRYRSNLEARPKVAKDMAQVKPELETITEKLSAEDIAFLDSAVLYHVLPGCNSIVIHGGFPPAMNRLPPDPANWSKYESQILYLRNVDSRGNMARFDGSTKDMVFWAKLYDGRFGHTYFGHQPFIGKEKPVTFPNATGFDLGCAFGGRLACIRVDEFGSNVFTVNARAQYAQPYMEDT